jgi:hypothetical protein
MADSASVRAIAAAVSGRAGMGKGRGGRAGGWGGGAARWEVGWAGCAGLVVRAGWARCANRLGCGAMRAPQGSRRERLGSRRRCRYRCLCVCRSRAQILVADCNHSRARGHIAYGTQRSGACRHTVGF